MLIEISTSLITFDEGYPWLRAGRRDGFDLVCVLSMIMGIMFTWPSSTLELFKSNETVLSHIMGPGEVALFGSLSSIGALVGTPLAGYLLDKIGRKRSSMLGGIPFLLAWSMIAAFDRVEVILAATFIAGIGGSTFVTSPVYISEICQDSIRGSVTAGSVIFYNLGVLLSYILGGYLSYYVMVYIQVTLAASYILFVGLLKDSPVYLMRKGREEEAAKSIAFYRNIKPDSKEVLEELYNIKRVLNLECLGNPEVKSLQPATVKPPPEKDISPWRYLSKRALFVCLTLVTASTLMGMIVVQVYADPLFKEAAPSIPSTLCTIIVAVVTMVAGLTAAALADRSGRRLRRYRVGDSGRSARSLHQRPTFKQVRLLVVVHTKTEIAVSARGLKREVISYKNLMLYSSGGSAVVTLLLGTQLELEWGPHSLTAILIYIFCFIYSIGAGTIPYIVVCEVFVPELKSFCTMIILEWAWVCSFIILLVFYPLVDTLGLGPVFYIFSIICLGTAIFCYFFQPETKGLPVDVIQNLFTKRQKLNNRIIAY
ncbi:Facilitated trehalose transporter Tret1 [Eumeta japonica]|uniref:Facilitated trehalose transporter Tret1 n=1 Tax=Eumeta variegata TaxID=151549 RepID=A0A4C1YWP0_EUMVA|nr:Facilitated trehalose transporter Tret1 [Eumeta japonica]